MVSSRLNNLKPSATIAITMLAKQLKKEGKDVLAFAAGEPDFNTPTHIKKAAINAINNNFTRYTASEGILELRKAVCEKLHRENHLEYMPENILISSGAKHSLTNAFLAILNKGDEVIVPAPYWVSYVYQVHLAEAVPVIAHTNDQFKLRADDIAKRITSKTKLIILNSPNNPTGMTIDKEELEKIAHLAVLHNIYVISDEVYEHFIYEGKHVSIASLNEDIKNLTVTINSVSKTYAMTGWRIGYAAGPSDIIKAMSTLQSQMTSNPSSIAQIAALQALSGPQEEIAVMRKAFFERRNFVVDALNKMKGIKCAMPEGAFYAFFDVRGTGMDDMTFCTKLLEEKLVALVPGSEFGAPGFVRLSYAASMDDLKKGMQRIKEFAESLPTA